MNPKGWGHSHYENVSPVVRDDGCVHRSRHHRLYRGDGARCKRGGCSGREGDAEEYGSQRHPACREDRWPRSIQRAPAADWALRGYRRGAGLQEIHDDGDRSERQRQPDGERETRSRRRAAGSDSRSRPGAGGAAIGDVARPHHWDADSRALSELPQLRNWWA